MHLTGTIVQMSVTSGPKYILMAEYLKLCLRGCIQRVNQGQQEGF